VNDAANQSVNRITRDPGVLRLGRKAFMPAQFVVMAIVNRTPDSFYTPGKTWDHSSALEYVDEVVSAGAEIVDIGGVPASPGDQVEVKEEIQRTAPFIAAVRSAHPDLVISIDTWRHQVGREACAAGADLVNDSWGGWDSKLAEVAAEYGVGYICTHVGTQPPRTRPFRVTYKDVMADVLDRTLSLATRAVELGVDSSSILIDPAHDFGKNTWHSLEITRRLDEMVATGWPVLVSISGKDFIDETIGLDDPESRLTATLATEAICAWLGARVFRTHNVSESIEGLKAISIMRGGEPPEHAIRGLV
jgi:dihydropteroate synthase